MKRIEIKKNRYADSVSLMSVRDKAARSKGIINVEVQMGTPANMEVLADVGFEVPGTVTPNDLVIAVSGEKEEEVSAALRIIEELLDRKPGSDETKVYHSLDEIELGEDGYDLVQISLPGEYAADEAKKALNKGLDVFIFSDNVALEEELELKRLGCEKGLLVMGPDCGVGLMGGVALAAGSIVRKGPVGIVGASGSGAQEVACIIEKCGWGVSSIIGTGGRDLYPEIGGLSMLAGMERLEKDPETDVIVLVSKLADLHVMDRVLTAADSLKKPVVAVFLGSDERLFEGHRAHGAFSLEDAALGAVRILSGSAPDFGYSDGEISSIVTYEMKKYDGNQKYFRGLFCGGTFTEESLICFSRHNPGVTLYSNLKTKYAKRLESKDESRGHTILDLGAEDFTADAPHPVFDPAIRLKRFEKELDDPGLAVILLDFITGPGVHEDPVTPFVRAVEAAQKKRRGSLTFIAAICGSLEDPQNVTEKETLLRDAGVIVTKSNYQSARLAGALMAALEEKGLKQ